MVTDLLKSAGKPTCYTIENKAKKRNVWEIWMGLHLQEVRGSLRIKRS